MKDLRVKHQPRRESEFIDVWSIQMPPHKAWGVDKVVLCDFFVSCSCFGNKDIQTATRIEDLPHQNAFGIVAKINKEECRAVFEKIDWNKYIHRGMQANKTLAKSDIIKAFEENYK